MLKQLGDLAEQLKKIWTFLALLVGLGVYVGTLKNTIETTAMTVKRLDSSIDTLGQRVTDSTGRIDRTIERRLDRAHDTVEKRLDANTAQIATLHDSVQRLIVLDEVRSGRRTYRPPTAMAGAPPPSRGEQIHLAEQDLSKMLGRTKVLRDEPLGDF